MKSNIEAEISTLGRMTVSQWRERYQEVFGEPTHSSNRSYLARRLAWRIQSLAEGGLSERARQRATELARDADLRTTLPRPPKVSGQGKTVVLPAPRLRTEVPSARPRPGGNSDLDGRHTLCRHSGAAEVYQAAFTESIGLRVIGVEKPKRLAETGTALSPAIVGGGGSGD